MAQEHRVQTTHIQHLIENGLRLAKACDGQGQVLDTYEDRASGLRLVADSAGPLVGSSYTIDALEKAAADLRHAAEELTAERLSLFGWPQ